VAPSAEATRTTEEATVHNKALVAQGGGPTAVINQSVIGVVLECRKFPQIERIYGALHGVRGIVDEEFLDLTQETTQNLELVAETPSSALGSTRDKPDRAYCREIFETLKAHEIGYFFYVGGNDSSDTVRIVAEEAKAAGYPLRSIHIPKTIDNDIVKNDHTPGYPSAARFVAQAFMGINLDNKALPGVYIAVVMGRNAGFLTAASALGKKFPDDGPHLIYLPERNFDPEAFVAAVKATHDRHGRCIVAVSEGHPRRRGPAHHRPARQGAHQGRPRQSRALRHRRPGRPPGRPRQGPARHQPRRADTFGYMQRSFVGCTSDIDQREAREVGEKAVKYALWGDSDGSVTIQRVGNYQVDYDLVPLVDVAAKTRTMPDHFIDAAGTGVTDQFHMYLRPLLGRGMPNEFRLQTSNRVPKIRKTGAK
jgi:ATP-dependent phosphofructokinase / diphosphate-dependent phosphofructokinase